MTDRGRAPEPGRDLDVLVLGEINPDVIVRGSDVRPRFGQAERLVDGIDLVIGSSSAIFACGAARLGLRVAFVGVVGNDAMGRFMLAALRDRGVDVSACRVDEALPTGASVILAGDGDRAILTAPGTMPSLRDEDVPATLVERARHLHVGSFFLLDALRPHLAERFAAARRSGLTTSLDSNWDPRGAWDSGLRTVLAQCDVFLPNATEARQISGRDALDDAARDLAGTGRTIVAIKCGADGALAAEPDGTLTAVPAIDVDPVDTTGAGDSFDAGFLAAWLGGRPVRECLALGVACGSLSTRGVGGTAAQPTLAEAEAAARAGGLFG